MRNLKYLLLAGCALLSFNAQAEYDLEYRVNSGSTLVSGTFYDDDEHDINLSEIKSLDIIDSNNLQFTNPNLKISGVIASNDSTSTLFFGQDGQENNFDFRGADWANNRANIEFRGRTTFELDASDKAASDAGNGRVLFSTVGGNVTKSDGSTINVFIQDGVLINDTDKLTVYVPKAVLDDNHLYNMTATGETLISYDFTRKSLSEIESEGYSADQAQLLSRMMSNDGIYNSLTREAQRGDTDYVKSALNGMLNPTQASNTAALNAAKENANVAAARMSGIAGGEEAEDVINLVPWVQGMFNHTHNTQSEGFRANTVGLALGIDAEINNAWMVGIGYSNVNSRIKTSTYSTRGYGDNGFIYGQYKPSNWYVRGMTGFGRTTYKDQNTKAKWKVDAYTANGSVGYIWGILDTSVGLRYTYLDNKPYKSSGATISAKDTDNLTAVLDFKVSQEYAAKDWLITPSAHLGFTQDIISAESTSNVNLGAGYGSYQVNGDRLHKTGVETGAGVIFKNGNCEFHLNYEGAFRQDNYSNAGLVKFKYNF